MAHFPVANFAAKRAALLDIPFSSQMPRFMASLGLTLACSFVTSLGFAEIPSMGADYKAKETVIARTDAPPVFINPITNHIPGNVLGPEDLEKH